MAVVARNYASGFERHYVGYTGVASGDSPLKTVEGGVTVFTATPEVLNIQALTMMVNEPELFAWDDQGRTWRIDAATGLATAKTATVNLTLYGIPQHAIRDPEQRIVYLTCTKALLKYFPDADVLKLFKTFATGETGHMAGYGGVFTPQRKGVIIVPPLGASGVADALWRHDESGWHPIALPTVAGAGRYWMSVRANPFNAQQWLLWGNTNNTSGLNFRIVGGKLCMGQATVSPLWYTPDAGATWQEVELYDPEYTNEQSNYRLGPPCWGESGGWIFPGVRLFGTFAGILWRGAAGGTFTGRTITTGPARELVPLIDGQGLDVVGRGSGAFVWIDDALHTVTLAHGLTASGVDPAPIERLPNSRAVIALNSDQDQLYTPDYRTTPPTVILSGQGSWPTATQDAVYIAGGGRLGILKVTGLDGTLTTEVVAAADTITGYIRADRQTRTVVAAKGGGGNNTWYVFDGTTWSTFPGPHLVGATGLGLGFEVLGG